MMTRNGGPYVQPWVVTLLLVVSCIVWFANFVLGVVLSDYKGSDSVNAVFLAVIGGIFAVRVTRKDDDDNR
jgi:hypothetical protein